MNVVKVKDATVWRTTSEIKYMEDAFGSCLAWPEDKVIMVRFLFIALFSVVLHKWENKSN